MYTIREQAECKEGRNGQTKEIKHYSQCFVDESRTEKTYVRTSEIPYYAREIASSQLKRSKGRWTCIVQEDYRDNYITREFMVFHAGYIDKWFNTHKSAKTYYNRVSKRKYKKPKSKYICKAKREEIGDLPF